MAYQNGTAANHADLLSRLSVFLTSHGDLVAAGDQWTLLQDRVEAGAERVLYFRAPGLSAGDEIFTVIHQFSSAGADYFNWGIRGATGYNALNPFTNQPGTSLPAHLLLWDTSIPYWFIANGRRCIVVAKVSTVYQCAYFGFITPHASPSEFPYPHFIGAMHYTPTKRWSNIDPEHKAFWNPAVNSGGAGATVATAVLIDPAGAWRLFGNYAAGNEASVNSSGGKVWPYTTPLEDMRTLFGSLTDYLLLPLLIHSSLDGGNTFGELDGVFFITGFSNASENLQTIAGKTYLVVQNAFRTSRGHYAAFLLE